MLDIESERRASLDGSGTAPGNASALEWVSACVTFKDLHVVAKKGQKPLLKNLSAQIRGGLTAIMGPSGSGKSTLLNTLAKRLDRGVTLSGTLLLNGRDYDNAELKRMSGYVMQDDVLNGNLTVEETLSYTARLRCAEHRTPAEREARVDRVLKQMGLDHCRDTMVGTPLKKGISGGERKRLCVGMELLMSPKLLFLDEPTSGLDSVTALMLCNILRGIAETCTVVCTIHQPQSKIFDLFDSLVLLSAGDISYQGPAKDALPYFEQRGLPCPPYTNPADYLLDSICFTDDFSHSIVAKDVESVPSHPLKFHVPHFELHHGSDKPRLELRPTTTWWQQFCVLLERCVKEQRRKKGTFLLQMAQVVVIGVLLGTAYLDIGTSQSSIPVRKSSLFFCIINQGLVASIITVNSFPGERTLSLRERAAGTYHVSAYVLAKMLAESFMQIAQPIVFACCCYWLIGYQAGADHFFIFITFLALCTYASTSLATMVAALCRTTNVAVTILPASFEISRLFGGFFLNPATIPDYFVWLDGISYIKYAYFGIFLNEYESLELYCTPEQLVDGPDGKTCPVTSGVQLIDKEGIDEWTMGECALALILYIVITRLIAYLGIRYLKW